MMVVVEIIAQELLELVSSLPLLPSVCPTSERETESERAARGQLEKNITLVVTLITPATLISRLAREQRRSIS